MTRSIEARPTPRQGDGQRRPVGAGIPETQRDVVFEPGHSTTDTGTGFGLGIVEQVADARGWNVTVTEGTDGGARFEITGVEFG